MVKVVVGGGDSDFVPASAGNHVARCYRLVDLGSRASEFYKDKNGTPKVQRQINLSFELPTELMESGKPFVISRYYTLSLHEKSNLRRDVESWVGKKLEEGASIDLNVLVGRPCLLSIIHEPRKTGTGERAVIKSIAAVPKGFTVPDAINESLIYDLDNHSEATFSQLPDWMREQIENSIEWRQREGKLDLPEVDEIDDSDLPF